MCNSASRHAALRSGSEGARARIVTLCVTQINPITVLGLTETSDVPQGGWLLQTAAGSVSLSFDAI